MMDRVVYRLRMIEEAYHEKDGGIPTCCFISDITIIATSSGDETDTSHLAHLTAAYGPHLASCDVCHVVPYTGMFVDGQDLANTTVCDPCQSPGGAYDGLNGPYIGAKGNWVSGGLVSDMGADEYGVS